LIKNQILKLKIHSKYLLKKGKKLYLLSYYTMKSKSKENLDRSTGMNLPLNCQAKTKKNKE